MMMMCWWLLLFAVIPTLMCETSVVTIKTDQIVHSLTRALHFFSSNLDQVNLDAGIGTRIAADQLRHCSSMKNLAELSNRITWKIAQSVQHRQGDYYAQLSFLLKSGIFSHIIPFKFRAKKHQSISSTICSASPFIEKHSDQCLHALISPECNETGSCMKFLTDPQACRYSLTHQILYFILAKHFHCTFHRSMNNEYQMISRMLNETRTIAEANFPEQDRDLFMEQIAIGGLLGWSEFVHEPTWLNAIIHWQHPWQGCYGNDTKHEKRAEIQMSHKCLSHRTSVAIAALAQMLRYRECNFVRNVF